MQPVNVINELGFENIKNLSVYQPIPFDGVWDSPSRNDCYERWGIIKSHIGELGGKTLLDVGCANGFFPFKFVQDGGESAVGVEIDKVSTDFVNYMANRYDLNVKCLNAIPERKFDVGLYLDLHFHEGIDYLPVVKQLCNLVFVSPSGNGIETTPRLKTQLLSHFFNVTETGWDKMERRMIFKCLGAR